MPTPTICMEKYLNDLLLDKDFLKLSEITKYIDKALDSGLFLYVARYPGMGDRFFAGAADYVSEGIGGEGFSLAPFFHTDRIISIPHQYSLREASEYSLPLKSGIDGLLNQVNFPFPEESTTEDEYCGEIQNIKESLSATGGKIVASRALVIEKKVDIAATYLNLCWKYPSAFVFLFKLNNSQIWMGASPEVLLIRDGEKGFTMSLAGTRLSDTDGEWDDKNVEEQQIVTKYIADTLGSLGISTAPEETFTLKAGPVEHICTPVVANFETITSSTTPPRNLTPGMILGKLAPTPALCGYPRREAMEVISKSEKFERAFYGGYCGLTFSDSSYALFVNLRSMRVEADKCALYAGGGITLKSQPDAEWEETERKLSTIQKNIIEKR